jgi:serine/threonine protein kinase
MSRTLKNGRYRIEGVLGSGAQGETLDGVDTTTGTPVAVKRFSVRGAASWKDVELAEREARVLSAIRHPKLPRYIDHFEEEGALYLVMDRVDGESLAKLRKRGATLPRDEVVRLLGELGEVLDYLHGRAPPIIHRDIKPGNVIRKPDGSYSLVDFGAVRDSLKPEGGSTVVGTFGFMGPEQFQGRALPQSDVYALGATALTLLTGREPEDLPHRGLAIDVKAALPHDPGFARVLEKMLNPDPDQRASRVTPLLGELFAAPLPHTSGGAWTPGSNAPGSNTRGPGTPDPVSYSKPLVASSIIALVLLVGLAIARVSTSLLFRLFLPVLLTLLSIFFGGGLKRTAKRMRKVGERGDEGLRHAINVVRGRTDRRRGSWKPPRRVRVDDEDSDDHFWDGNVHRRRRRE